MAEANVSTLTPPADVDERGWWADRIWLPWIDRVKPLADSCVLEYGCGPGSVSRAVAPRARNHIGLDIDADYIEIARKMAADARQANSEFYCHPPSEIVEAFRAYGGHIDVVLLYAVLEHLTIEERLDVLKTAREVVRPHGVIAVVELPNRLVDFDQHSSWLPYANQLPDDLALDYLERASRTEFRESVLNKRDHRLPARSDAGALMALRRFGRGASFHEFELVWGDDLSDCVLMSNWDPMVIPHREIDANEVALARSLSRRRPDLDPCWSRQWIDLVISPDAGLQKAATFRPWIGLAGPCSHHVAYTSSEVAFLGQPDSALHVELPEPTSRLAVRVVDGESSTPVLVEGLHGELIEAHADGSPGTSVTVTLDLPGWYDDLLVRLPRGGWITALLYEGYGV